MQTFSETLKVAIDGAMVGLWHVHVLYQKMDPIAQWVTDAFLAALISIPIIRLIRRRNRRTWYKATADAITNGEAPQAAYYRLGGFWRRVALSLVDVFILALLLFAPVMFFTTQQYVPIFGSHSLSSSPYGIYAVLALFWGFVWVHFIQSTPAKLFVNMYIIDAKSGDKPSIAQCAMRLVGHGVCLLTLGFGYLWAAWDPKKQGLHDKIADTIVVQKYQKTAL